MKKSNALHWVGSIARTLLALTFLFSGFVKAVDPLGTTYKIEDYLKAFGGFFTDLIPLAEAAAVCLIAIEFTLGFCMLLNVRTQWTSWLSLVFYTVMLPLTLYIAIANPVSDCGCFGDALVISNWATFWKNVVLMTLVIILLCTKRYIPQTFVLGVELGIAVIGLAIAGGIMLYTRTHLPLLDFRPYKIGNNIPELMEIPDDADPDQYTTTFIYEKDGVEQEFTLDNYPKGDSTWTFVDQKSTLIKKGYEPKIHDFEILTLDYDDITYDVLESEVPVTLVIMYDLAKTDLRQIDKVNALYNECIAKEEPFYILTGSGEQDIELFCFGIESDNRSNMLTPFNHPDMVFCTCDPVTLKTIVRANPGVIVVENGTIIDKYNIRNR
ncbi:MAG: DoxX family protein [Paludibacteraceae bacterium]|nr:DoxX family protein [Paludibacteraceae bacterium]